MSPEHSGIVDRVEVVTGGSSATYGSDAVSGVINIITQQSQEGFSFDARTGFTTEGGGEEYSLDLDFGTRFADGRGLVATIDPVTGAPGQIRPGYIPLTNPFIPDEILNDPDVQDDGRLSWDRRMAEVGNFTTDNERATWRTWAGLQGSMFDDWDWDLSVGYGNFEQYQVRSNAIDVRKEAQALDAIEVNGEIRCRDDDAHAAGCVPLNLFGVGSITPEMADWLRVNPIINPTVELFNVLGYTTGELFEMPAGNVGAVFGFEWRRDSMNLRVSDGPRYGGITFNLVPPIKGDFDVAELFTELSFPLAEQLTADVSMRVADYSMNNIDTVFSYSTGLVWEPADGYMLRANFARAQRAPDITELLSPRRGDYDNFDDICADVSATSDEVGHDNCRLEPAIAALIAADPVNFVFEDENSGYGPAIGNEDLFEETADTYTIGISIAPDFLEGFRLAVDYYDITISDAIIEMENSEIMKQCYASSVPLGQPNMFCDDITRDDEGQIVEILNRQLNLNEQSTSGFDVALDYVFDTDSIGEFQFVTHYTHISKHEEKFDGLDGVVTVDFNNQLDFGIFEDVATASLAWRHEDWRLRWRTTWKGPIIDHNERVDEYLEDVADNDAPCAAGDPDCVENPEVAGFLFYGSYIRHDLSASYDMTLDSGVSVNLYAGVRNMFDKDVFVPRTGDAYEGGIGNYDSKFGGGIGRYVYVGMEMRFDD